MSVAPGQWGPDVTGQDFDEPGGAVFGNGPVATAQPASTPAPGGGLCVQGGPVPTCPAGQTPVWSQASCSWVCSGEAASGEGSIWDRLGDVLGGLGGGGVIAPPQPAPPTVGLVPAEQSRVNVWAILLLLIAVGAGAYYWYQRRRRRG